jgi:hypothetical protein
MVVVIMGVDGDVGRVGNDEVADGIAPSSSRAARDIETCLIQRPSHLMACNGISTW